MVSLLTGAVNISYGDSDQMVTAMPWVFFLPDPFCSFLFWSSSMTHASTLGSFDFIVCAIRSGSSSIRVIIRSGVFHIRLMPLSYKTRYAVIVDVDPFQCAQQ